MSKKISILFDEPIIEEIERISKETRIPKSRLVNICCSNAKQIVAAFMEQTAKGLGDVPESLDGEG